MIRAKFLSSLSLSFVSVVLASFTWNGPTHAQPYEDVSAAESNIRLHSTLYQDQKIYYAFAGDQQKPGLLFIHGTPGSWQAFGRYLRNPTLQRDYFMVSVDRLGWGQSIINEESNGSSNVSGKLLEFTPQAESIKAIMDLYPEKRWLLVGHSLGASIAPKIALIAPQEVAGMLLLAGSLSPRLGKPRWYNVAASMLLVKWLLPRNLKYSNDEIMVLKNELQLLETELADTNLTTQVVIMQGMKDRLVSPKNAAYARSKWPATFANLSVIELPNAGHFLPWEQTQQVVEAIRSVPLQ